MANKSKSTGTVDNENLEHTEGGATTRDAMDAGVPMAPGQPDEPVGPEDAFASGTRGDYSDRLDSGPHLVTVENPDADVDKGEPRFKLVPAGSEADDRPVKAAEAPQD